MAHKQQPLYLHLAELTASQFLDIWKHYDSDGRSSILGLLLSDSVSSALVLVSDDLNCVSLAEYQILMLQQEDGPDNKLQQKTDRHGSPSRETAATGAPAGRRAGTEAPAGRRAGTEAPAGRRAGTEAPAGRWAGMEAPAGRRAGTEAPAGRWAGTEAPAGRWGVSRFPGRISLSSPPLALVLFLFLIQSTSTLSCLLVRFHCTVLASLSSQTSVIFRFVLLSGNGYIEGKELESFFQELEAARRGAGVEGSSINIGEKLKEFMQKYDKNADGRIEMAEVSARPASLLHGAVPALKPQRLGFWRCLVSHSRGSVTVCHCVSIQLAQILPTEENFLLCFRQHAGSSTEFMEAWRKYDTDRSGYIEANELK
ncbi:unnamed protein product, partial [Ranitomeya imitator]